ncbi:MAG: dihydroorotate dehydrogenase electron transfer subunit [Deltaproteobacteria bacterium]|nr:dihydroorotate dehydrogenase electron transfer subunit [Deltaproteobacteria bacterium]MCL5792146.1 dihydroorotate dehydrogenase electron transfer subunit [Deltaproteobacteria bacterium]
MKKTHTGIVASIKTLASDYLLLSIKVEDVFKFIPGQFVMLKVSDTYDPLLLRPFSIMRAHKNIYEFLIKIRGRGTGLIANLKKNDFIYLTGPFGNGFPVNTGRHPIIVAGGAGIASVYSLARKLKKDKKPFKLLYGAITKKELVMLEDLKIFDPLIATDDGSYNYHGTVTSLLDKTIEYSSTVFACGPMPMLYNVKHIAKRHKSACYVSLESRMACGFGVCLGCTIFDMKGNTIRVCKEGPVFNAEDFNLEDYH